MLLIWIFYFLTLNLYLRRISKPAVGQKERFKKIYLYTIDIFLKLKIIFEKLKYDLDENTLLNFCKLFLFQ